MLLNNHMKNTKFHKLSLLIGSFAAAALIVPVAYAGDCGQDPIYSKKMIGKPTVGLRVRDVACMEGSKILTVVAAGTPVQIIAETDGWYKVQIGQTIGWMGSSLIKVDGSTAATKGELIIEKAAEKNKNTALIEKNEVMKTADIGQKKMIGILERDFEKVKKGDRNMAARLKDKVLLRVQKKGETWYVEKNGGLTQVKMYEKNKFKRLNATTEKKEKTEAKKIEKVSPDYTPTDEVTLKASTLPGAISLEWTQSTLEGFAGYKVVRSETDADLHYPKNGYVEFLSNRDQLYHIDGTAVPGKTYFYRVCARVSGTVASCGNVVRVTARQR